MKASDKKIVIGVHGLGNKPPENILRSWWKNSIIEGLKKYNYPLKDFNFEMAYWADILHNTPLDPENQNKKSPHFMKEKYEPEEPSSFAGAMNFREKAVEYLEKYYEKIIVNGVLSLNNPSLTDLFIHLHLRDLEIYYSDSKIEHNGVMKSVREIIIKRFCEKIKMHSDKKILLIAHSMGSIIVQDALFDYLPHIKIDTLVTIGSPLAQEYVIRKYRKEQKNGGRDKLQVAGNIVRNWFNLSDLQDQVAINHRLSEFYKANKKGIIVTDILVKNRYEYEGNCNPHKSFGYLRTPEFSEIINQFLTEKKFSLTAWLKEKFWGLLHS